jgi:hypothetical protein
MRKLSFWLCGCVLLLLAGLALTTCGTSGFQAQWQAALAAPAKADPLAGAWEGTWQSDHNGHSGRLRAIIGPDLGQGRRSIRYHATWGKVLSGGFKAEHQFQRQGAGYQFKGRHQLGKWGDFDYDGTVQGTEFQAKFSASGDHGTFSMKRLVPEPSLPSS